MCDAIDSASISNLKQRMDELTTRLVSSSCRFAGKTDDAEQPNLSVRIDSQTRSLVGVESPWEMRVVVKNHSKSSQNNVVLTVAIDDVAIASRKFDVPGEAETQAVFWFEFKEPSSHKVVAKIDVDEPVTGDNQAAWSVVSIGAIPVLVVDPTLNDQSRLAESEIPAGGLKPFSLSRDQKPTICLRSLLFCLSNVLLH